MTRARGAERRSHNAHNGVVVCGVAQPRNRPTLTVTIDADVMLRLRDLADGLPGSSLSHLVEELLVAALPTYEGMLEAMLEARGSDGVVDEGKARRLAGAFIGARVARAIDDELQDTEPSTGEGVE